MKKIIIKAALFGAISLPFAACADTPMEMLIETPTRMSQPLDQTIADTTVLTQQDIRNSGATDVPTLLRLLPGVEVAQLGGLGSQSSVFMRGTNSDQVLVLLDGVRINSATTGSTALEHIMLDSVERIEVVRGNVSSLYGSEAIGGVIQIFTKQGHGAPVINASAGIGSHGTQRLAAGYSGDVNDTSFSVNAGRVRTDGVSAINPQLAPLANPNNNGYDNDTLDAQVKHAFNADHSVSASIFDTRGNISYDNAYGSPTDLNNMIENINKFSLSSDNRINEIWQSTVRLAQGVDDSHTYLNDVEQSRIQTENNQLTWQNNLKIADTQHVNLAAEHLGEAVTSTILYTQTSRNVNSFLGGYVGEFGTQQVQFNLRQDRYSDFGTANTGLLGYGLSFADSWRATASVSNAFKAPTFNDMYGPPSWGSNPNLKPEQANNREVGLHYASKGQHVALVYFDNRIHNLVIYPGPLYIAQNVDRAQIDGQELSYAGDFGSTHLKVDATFQNPRDSLTGQVLIRRAREYGNVAVSHDLGAWQMGAAARYSGVREDYDLNGNPVTLTSYTLLNLTARYRIDRNLNLSLSADNVFNRDYSEAYAYNTLGRTLFIGLNYQQ